MVAIKAVTGEDKEQEIVRELFAGYQNELGEDLLFQDFDAELANPLQKYGPPGGVVFLAWVNGQAAGCVALAPLPVENGIKTCEMKRLYVKPGYRQHGLGRMLIETLIQTAAQMGYGLMKLDTLRRLETAVHLYHRYGFVETSAYYPNPLPGVVYMQRHL